MGVSYDYDLIKLFLRVSFFLKIGLLIFSFHGDTMLIVIFCIIILIVIIFVFFVI